MPTPKAQSPAPMRREFSAGDHQGAPLTDQPPSNEPVKYSFPSLIEAIIDSNRAYEIAQIVKSAQHQVHAGSKEEGTGASSAGQPQENTAFCESLGQPPSALLLSAERPSRPTSKVLSLEEARLKQQRAMDRYFAKFETTAQKVISHSSLTREEKIKWFEWHIEHQYNLSEAYHDKGPQYKARVAAHIEEMLLHKLRELLK